jgi:hypothetical protein
MSINGGPSGEELNRRWELEERMWGIM